MLFKTVLTTLVTIVCVSRATAQVTTTLPFEISDGLDSSDGSDDSSDVIVGEIIGTGADGTTYVFSETATDAGDTPLTITLVENASAASAIVAVNEDGAIGTESIACGFNGDGSAVCTEAFVIATDSFTTTAIIVTSGVADTLTAVVSTATGLFVASTGSISSKSGASGASSATGSASGAGASQSASSAGRTTVGVIAGALSLVLAAVMA